MLTARTHPRDLGSDTGSHLTLRPATVGTVAQSAPPAPAAEYESMFKSPKYWAGIAMVAAGAYTYLKLDKALLGVPVAAVGGYIAYNAYKESKEGQ